MPHITKVRHFWKHSLLVRKSWLIKISLKFIPLIALSTLAIHLLLVKDKDISSTWPEHQTRSVQKLIQPYKKTYKINSFMCSDDDEQILLIIVVTSAIKNFKRRQAIRETWGKDVITFSKRMKLLFLVGELPNDMLQIEINQEHKNFGDVLQASFIDSYANLTIKSLFMLKWFSQFCTKHTQYLMKVDDDMYINIPEVYSLVRENVQMNMLTGFMHCGAAPMKQGKNYAPPYMHPPSTYPNFLSGTAYVMSNTTAAILYRTSMMIPAFHLEDVHLTGMLPSAYNQLLYQINEESLVPSSVFQDKALSTQEKEVHPHNDGRFNIYNIEKDPCLYANLISSHELDIQEIHDIHEKVTKLRKISDYNRSVCSYHKKSYKGQKICNSKNTMFGGKGECCGYIDYIKLNFFSAY